HQQDVELDDGNILPIRQLFLLPFRQHAGHAGKRRAESHLGRLEAAVSVDQTDKYDGGVYSAATRISSGNGSSSTGPCRRATMRWRCGTSFQFARSVSSGSDTTTTLSLASR